MTDVLHENNINDGSTVEYMNTSSGQAQSFLAESTYTITYVKVRTMNPTPATGSLIAAIYATSASKPTGSALVSGTVDASTIGASKAWTTINFSSGYELSSGTTYALVLDGRSLVGNVFWYKDTSSSYTNGIRSYTFNYSTWYTSSSRDFQFQNWEGEISVSLDEHSVIKRLVAAGNSSIYVEDI